MKRFLMVIMPFVIIAAVFVIYNVRPEAEPTYYDTQGHFAEEKIEKWSRLGIIGGSYGKFRPDDGVTRAEMCTIISRIVSLPEAAENEYSDLEDGEWYTDTMLGCVAAGIISGEDGLLRPDEKLSRSDGLEMLLRALGGDDGRSGELWQDTLANNCEYFEQYGLYNGPVEIEYYSHESFDTSGELTRAELVMILDACQNEGYLDIRDR